MARYVISGLWKDKAVKDATKSLKGLEKTTSMFAAKTKAAYLAAGAAAGYYAKRVLKESIQNALADEKAQRSLALTLKNVASATDNAVFSAEAQISSMGKIYGITDDVLRPSLARLARSTQDVATAQSALTLAMSISAATGKDIETISAALGKAYDGNTASLSRLGLGVDSTILKSKDMNKIMTALRKTFKGFAEQEANTAAGGFRRLKTAADEAQEVIGVALIDAINSLVAQQGGIDKVAKSFGKIAQAIADIIRSMTILNNVISGSKLNKIANYLFVEPYAQGWQKIVNAATLLARKERENLAIAKSKTAQVISARNAEYVALKKLKELDPTTTTPDNRTELQRIADAMAAKAGFKVAEDLDSLNKIAAANRLEENRQYVFSSIDAFNKIRDAFIETQKPILTEAEKTLKELKSYLDDLAKSYSKGFEVPIWLKVYQQSPSGSTVVPPTGAPTMNDVLGSSNTGMGGFAAGATPSFFPEQGGAGTPTVVNNNISVTAGQAFSTTQEIQNYLLDAMLAAQRQGTLTSLNNGGR
jgi:hypothetical protein